MRTTPRSVAPTHSVVMATYNGSRFIAKQLDSIANQTLLPVELIVRDDGSTDGTPDIVADWARSAPFEVLVERAQQRSGWRHNFHLALACARGDLISFCDQDDVWQRSKLAHVSEPFQDEDVQLVSHSLRVVGKDGRSAHRRLGPTRSRWEPAGSGSPWRSLLGLTMTFRSGVRAYDEYWSSSIDKLDPSAPAAHDQWAQFVAGLLGTTVLLRRPLVDYRQHGFNAVGMGHKFTSIAELADADRVRERRRLVENRLQLLDALPGLPGTPAAQARYRRELDLLQQRQRMYAEETKRTRRIRLFAQTAPDSFRLNGREVGGKDVMRDAIALTLAMRRSGKPNILNG